MLLFFHALGIEKEKNGNIIISKKKDVIIGIFLFITCYAIFISRKTMERGFL